MTEQALKRTLRDLQAQEGYSKFFRVVKELIRERVNPEREKREKYSKSQRQKMFDRQKGICPICREPLNIPAYSSTNEVDHIDPHREDFGHRSNLQLVHADPCNSSKSSKSVPEQAKESGRTYTEILQPGIENDEDPNGI